MMIQLININLYAYFYAETYIHIKIHVLKNMLVHASMHNNILAHKRNVPARVVPPNLVVLHKTLSSSSSLGFK